MCKGGALLCLHAYGEGDLFSLFAQGYFPQQFTYVILTRGGKRGADSSDFLGVGRPLGRPICKGSGDNRHSRVGVHMQGRKGAVSLICGRLPKLFIFSPLCGPCGGSHTPVSQLSQYLTDILVCAIGGHKHSKGVSKRAPSRC